MCRWHFAGKTELVGCVELQVRADKTKTSNHFLLSGYQDSGEGAVACHLLTAIPPPENQS